MRHVAQIPRAGLAGLAPRHATVPTTVLSTITVSALPPQVAAALRQQAAALRAAGRHGDSVLAHITAAQAALLHRLGGRGSRNPVTGALEFFDGGPAATPTPPPPSPLSGITAGLLAPVQRFATQAYNDVLAQPIGDIGHLLSHPDEIPNALASAAPGIAPVAADLPQGAAAVMSAVRALGAAPAANQPPPSTAPGPAIVYRGNDKTADEVFSGGFNTRGRSMDLLRHATDNKVPPSGFVGTSKSPEVARLYGPNVYVIRPRNGIDVNEALEAESPVPGDQEIAIPGRIEPEDIHGLLNEDGSMLPNPNFKP